VYTPAMDLAKLPARDILDAITQGAIIIDGELNLRYFNAAYAELSLRYGQAPPRLDQPLDKAFPFLPSFVVQNPRIVLQTQKPTSSERYLAFEGGGEAWVETHCMPLMEAGKVTLAMVLITDVTERKRAGVVEKERQFQLMQAGKLAALGELISGMAHEVNNPNNYIRLNTDNLLDLWKDLQPWLDRADKQEGGIRLEGLSYAEACREFESMLKGIREGSERWWRAWAASRARAMRKSARSST